jgi:3-methylcrotonyl-CoA carboxylase alpha subunit
LPFAQSDLAIDGHAVEARLYAEDPETGFLPSTGRLWALRFPDGEGIRIDTGVEEGGEVTPYYDPMIAKVIARAPTRGEALDRLADALGRTVVAGPRSNVAFLRALALAPEFREGRFDTGFIDRHLEALGAVARPLDARAVAAGALALFGAEQERVAAVSGPAGAGTPGPWDVADGFQTSGPRVSAWPMVVEGERLDVLVAFDREGPSVEVPGHPVPPGDHDLTLVSTDEGLIVLADGRQTHMRLFDPLGQSADDADGGGIVKAPMHGKVVAVFVAAGETVEKGQRVAIVEAMKMEHSLVAPRAGIVSEVAVEPGQQVGEGARMLVIADD